MRMVIFAYALILSATRLSPAMAAIPDAAQSTVPQRLVACPAGDIVIEIIVRDGIGNPLNGKYVELRFAGCPSALHCDSSEPEYVWDPVLRRARHLTIYGGSVKFPLLMGGTCESDSLVVTAGVLLGRRALASPDFRGDGIVDNADRQAIESLIGTIDPKADLDGDGTVTSADLTVVDAHMGHACAGMIPTQRSTLGRVRATYR